MAIRDIFKISRKTFLNPAGWIDANTLKVQNQTIWEVLKSIFTKPKPDRKETFAAAMKRLGVSDADVEELAQSYGSYALLFAVLGLMTFIYAFYLLFRYKYFLSWMMALAVSGLFFSQAFQYDFWRFQIKRRKLGATFDEWKRAVLGIKDTSA